MHAGEREHFEERMKARTVQIHKFATQCQLHANRVTSLEQILQEYRLAVNELASGLRPITNPDIVRTKQNLNQKENQLKAKLQEE
jgi:hypothetical protein